jgi:predicted dehydrogenase
MTHALHAACFRDFVDSLDRGVPFRINGESARRAVEVIQAIYASAQTDKHVRLPL